MSDSEVRYKRSKKIKESRLRERDNEYRTPKREPYKKQNKKMRVTDDFITDDD